MAVGHGSVGAGSGGRAGGHATGGVGGSCALRGGEERRAERSGAGIRRRRDRMGLGGVNGRKRPVCGASGARHVAAQIGRAHV